MRQATTETSKMIRTITIIGDYFILNTIFIFIYLIFNEFQYNTNIGHTFQKYLVLLNLGYIPCISIFKVVLHKRIITPEIIIRRVFFSTTTFIFLFVSCLSLIQTEISKPLIFTLYITLLVCISFGV